MGDQQNQAGIGLHVLVAEDNQLNQMVAKKMLEKLGCTCVIVADGSECLRQLEGESFDIILMDCMMPKLDGLEATRQIRASGTRYAGIPVIAFSASTTEEDRKTYHDAGMNDCIDKPVTMDRLTEVLTRQY